MTSVSNCLFKDGSSPRSSHSSIGKGALLTLGNFPSSPLPLPQPEAITACTCEEAKANRTSKWNWKGSWEKALTTERKLVGNLRFVCVNYSSSSVKAVCKTWMKTVLVTHCYITRHPELLWQGQQWLQYSSPSGGRLGSAGWCLCSLWYLLGLKLPEELWGWNTQESPLTQPADGAVDEREPQPRLLNTVATRVARALHRRVAECWETRNRE